IYSDVDSDSNTWNSSTAELKLSLENGADPTCSNIIYAGLYWTGRAHNDGNSPMTFDVTKDVPQTINVNEFQNLKHGEDINYSGYDLEVSREGGSNNRYPFFDIRFGSSSSSRYRFAYTNNSGSNRVTLRIGGGSTNDVPATFSTSGNIETAVFDTPVVINDGGLIITINSLKRDVRVNESESNYRNTSEVNLHLGGTYTSNVSVTKTFNKREVLIKGPTSATYTPVPANVNDIYYPNNADGNMYSAYAEVTDYVKLNGIGSYTV